MPIYLDAGKDDLIAKKLINSTRRFHQTLNQLGIQNVFYVFPGDHGLSGANYGWNYDHKHVADSLTGLTQSRPL